MFRSKIGSPLLLSVFPLCFALAQANADGLIGFGALSAPPATHQCITPLERLRVQKEIALYHRLHPNPPFGVQSAPQSYAFYPQAGTLWEDLFTTNFADLNATTGILDFDGFDWTYNGHQGHDTTVRSFAEQAGGVPIFAALDGVVVATHDGEFDQQTAWSNGAVANYVVLHHGGSHYSYYWHMKKNSVAVALNQVVKAGQQLGLTGSSGYSTYPHLHFESWNENVWYEPSAGPSRPGPSNWVSQQPVPRTLWLDEFIVNDSGFGQGLPYDLPRKGYFLTGLRSLYFAPIVHNVPLSSTWRVRFLRPNGSVAYDSANNNLNNTIPYRWAWFTFQWNINFDVTGAWKVEFRMSNQTLIQAPFTVVSTVGAQTNRPPLPVTTRFDPVAPKSNDVLFCRVTRSIPGDLDYELVRYRYKWTVNGNTVRDVLTAAQSDAIPRNTANPTDLVRCEVTPMDATTSGATSAIQAVIDSPSHVSVAGAVTLLRSETAAQLLTFEFRPKGGGPPFTREATPAANGNFTISNLIAANYDVAVRGQKWLQKVVPNVNAANGDVSGLTASLTPGDTNGDNLIDLFDLVVLFDAYGTEQGDAGWNARSDFNNDSIVDLFDLVIVFDYYGEAGDD